MLAVTGPKHSSSFFYLGFVLHFPFFNLVSSFRVYFGQE